MLLCLHTQVDASGKVVGTRSSETITAQWQKLGPGEQPPPGPAQQWDQRTLTSYEVSLPPASAALLVVQQVDIDSGK